MKWLEILLSLFKSSSPTQATEQAASSTSNDQNKVVIEQDKQLVEKIQEAPVRTEETIEVAKPVFMIRDDFLCKNGRKVTTFDSPHKNVSRNICDFVIMHYTGSHGTYKSSTTWAGDPNSKVSWHLTIGRNGEVNQHIDGLRSVLWHAGKSSWEAKNTGKTYNSLNRYSIGIEMANAGKLTKNDKGRWVNPYGKLVQDANVFIHEDGTGWEKFTDVQIGTACSIALLLAEEYSCVDILGHEDIAPGRKIDPGPAFPLQKLKDDLRKQAFYKFK